MELIVPEHERDVEQSDKEVDCRRPVSPGIQPNAGRLLRSFAPCAVATNSARHLGGIVSKETSSKRRAKAGRSKKLDGI
jgi:hypothetical protein